MGNSAMPPGKPRRPRQNVQLLIDTRSLEVESENRALIAHHLDECRERYKSQDEKHDKVLSAVADLRTERETSSRQNYWIVIKAAGAVIMALLTGMGTLAVLLLQHGR